MVRIRNFFGALAFASMLAIPSISAALSSATDPQDPWGEFSFGAVGSFAESGTGFVPSAGDNSFYLGTPPWTFTGSGILIVQDAFLTGDQFRVFDNNIAIGDTSTPVFSDVGCGSDPVDCFADLRASRGVFTLGPGDHSFTIQMLLSPHFDRFGAGAAFFCIDTGAVNCGVSAGGDTQVPEPSSMVLVAVGFLGAFVWVKRPELCRSVVGIIRKRERR